MLFIILSTVRWTAQLLHSNALKIHKVFHLGLQLTPHRYFSGLGKLPRIEVWRVEAENLIQIVPVTISLLLLEN